jgi:flagellar biosynthesis GTPase FlhF
MSFVFSEGTPLQDYDTVMQQMISIATDFERDSISSIEQYRVDLCHEPVCVGYDKDLNRMQSLLISKGGSNFISSGMLVIGPSGVGKTTIVHRLAYLNRRRFRFISVSCADLVHKVSPSSSIGI